jgi:hypothetical protein
MHTLIRSKLILTLAALVLMAAAVAVPLALSGGYSHAAPAQRHASNRGKPDGTAFRATRKTRSVRAHVHHNSVMTSATSVSGDPFLYVDDGSFFDLIDVFQVSTTSIRFVGNFHPAFSSFSSGFFGTQDIAVTPANGIHTTPCLVYIDNSNGLVDSFRINATTGLPVSASQPLPNTNPIDVHISQDGTLVYVNSLTPSNTSQLASYSLGAGCVLTAKATLSTGRFYVSFALASLTRLVTVDSNSNTHTIDTYALTPSGGIGPLPLKSVTGQISFQPDSVAVQTTGGSDVFTGQATFNPPLAQGGNENLSTGDISFLSGSPKRDPDFFNSDGAAVFVDNSDSLLVQGEQGSATLVLYSFTASSMALKENDIFLDFQFAEPTSFAQLGNILFVNGGVGGDVEACPISSSGIPRFGCRTVAVLSDSSGFAGGSVIL